ncbi:nidogen-like domain-containing protein [Desulfobacter postgatei]|uniref:nidogen-like domain-containing protein n=1 Tax=Desulfobacter postgatei TaxID=2293 RepID=UPI00259B14D4|nr:nidogen-like domain-containing protein [uncultured Desulfobacter sp.]
MKKILFLLFSGMLFVGLLSINASATSLVTGLGGAENFGENQLADNDDGSTSFLNLSSVFSGGMDFYGTNYSGLYLNNNGNVTFVSSMYTYTPYNLIGATGNPIIAPFFADVDTRGTGDVYWDLDTTNNIFTATWDAVGYYSYNTSPTNSFQLRLIDQGNGDFDIEFRYETLGWTVGSASGTAYARAGYNSGNGTDYYELPQSGSAAAMLGLVGDSNVNDPGRFLFQVRNGAVIPDSPVPEPSTMILFGLALLGFAGVSRKKTA